MLIIVVLIKLISTCRLRCTVCKSCNCCFLARIFLCILNCDYFTADDGMHELQIFIQFQKIISLYLIVDIAVSSLSLLLFLLLLMPHSAQFVTVECF